MMIAARNAFLMGAKPWANPYIADGLIAMWDGEWNAGGGVHDSTVTKWTDCAGGFVATTTDANLTWGDNYCSSPSFRFFAPVSVGETINAAIRSKAFTLECIVSSPDATNNVIVFATCNGSDIYDRIDFNNTPNNALTTNFNSTSTLVFYKEIPFVSNRFSVPTRFVYSPTSGGIEVSIKSSTTDMTITKAFSIPSNVNTITEFTLGRPTFVSTKNTTLYRVAFYSRALTAAEVAANYAIDAARFGI